MSESNAPSTIPDPSLLNRWPQMIGIKYQSPYDKKKFVVFFEQPEYGPCEEYLLIVTPNDPSPQAILPPSIKIPITPSIGPEGTLYASFESPVEGTLTIRVWGKSEGYWYVGGSAKAYINVSHIGDYQSVQRNSNPYATSLRPDLQETN